jgi:hypothetical protein
MARKAQATPATQAKADALADIAQATQADYLAPAGADNALMAGHNALVARVGGLETLMAELKALMLEAQSALVPTSTPAVKAPKAKAEAKAPTPKAQGTLRKAKSAAEAKRLRAQVGAGNAMRYVCITHARSGYWDKFATKHSACEVVQVGA